MNKFRKFFLAFSGMLVVFSPLVAVSPATAAVAVSLSQQTSLVDGAVISVQLTGVPATQGVYVQQCYMPQIGLRAATGLKCNGSLQQTDVMIWATMDGARGSQSAAAPIPFTVRETVTVGGITYPCGTWDCYLTVYRDHRGLSDTSLDTIVPLVFLAKQTVKMRSFGLAKDGAGVKVGGSLRLDNESMSTEEGTNVRTKSATPKVCTVSPGKLTMTVRFISKGTCTLTVTAKGDAVYKPYSAKVSYTVS